MSLPHQIGDILEGYADDINPASGVTDRIADDIAEAVESAESAIARRWKRRHHQSSGPPTKRQRRPPAVRTVTLPTGSQISRRPIPKRTYKMPYRTHGKNLHHRVNALAKAVRGEVKCYDRVQNVATLTAPTIDSISVFSGIVEGTGENERVGKHIHVKAIEISGYPCGDVVEQGEWGLCRPDAGTLAYSDFIQCPGGRLAHNKGWTLHHVLMAPQTGTNSKGAVSYRYKFKYPMRITYNNVGSVTDNDIRIYTKTVNNNLTNISYHVRIWYTDN